MLEAYKFLTDRKSMGAGGSWAGLRYRVYCKEVLHLTNEERSAIPQSRTPCPPMSWSIPPEYMVAYLRKTGLTKAAAIKKVEKDYIPKLELSPLTVDEHRDQDENRAESRRTA